MLREEDSLGQDATDKEVDDLKVELALLNVASKDLNKNWDDQRPPQMDTKDDLKTVLEKLIEHTFDKVP